MTPLERVLQAVYLAAQAPERWPDALDEVAAVLGATAWDLAWSGGEAGAGRLSGGGGVESAATEGDAAGPARLGLELRFDLGEGVVATLQLARSGRQPDFGAQARRLADAIHPHLQRCLAWTATFLQAADTASAAALDHVGTPCLVVDADGRVLFANAAAQRLCDGAMAVAILDRGLGADGATVTRDLWRRFSELASQPASAPEAATHETVLRHGGGALIVKGVSLRGLPFGRAARIALYVYDAEPLAPRPDDAVRLERLFALTPSEADVVRRWIGGHSVVDIARARGSSVPTVRAQLRVAMDKTGVARSADLFRVRDYLGASQPS